MKIKYEMHDKEYRSITQCPNKVMGFIPINSETATVRIVGSVACGFCEHHEDQNFKQQTVTCNYGEEQIQ